MKTTTTTTALLAFVLMAGAAAPAYRCSSSTRTIDDAGYSGPWPDNWRITVRVCAARSGSTVHAYAEVRWDGPVYPTLDDPTILDGAKLRLQIKPAGKGGPLLARRDFPGIERALEHSDGQGDHNGAYRTPTITHRAGPRALADAALLLDWHNDGHGYSAHDYTASPTV